VLLLSATIRNAKEICGWLAWMRGSPCEWVAAYERPVPLFPLFLFPGGELAPLGTRRGLLAKIDKLDPKSLPRSEIPEIPKILGILHQANLLPAIFFLKSRSDCDKAVTFCRATPKTAKLEYPMPSGKARRTADVYPFLRGNQHLPKHKNCRFVCTTEDTAPLETTPRKMKPGRYLDAISRPRRLPPG